MHVPLMGEFKVIDLLLCTLLGETSVQEVGDKDAAEKECQQRCCQQTDVKQLLSCNNNKIEIYLQIDIQSANIPHFCKELNRLKRNPPREKKMVKKEVT